jgi:hypothetical protein
MFLVENEFTAFDLNDQGYGIFWTVNEFDGSREIENLVKINSWALDIDTGTKPEMLSRIKLGLHPSMLVETKRGYHVYFNAKSACPEHWNTIMEEYLIPFYGADPKAKDLARVLRAPGYKHMKNPTEPFEIKLVKDFVREGAVYSEKTITDFYRKSRKQRRKFLREKIESETKDPFWKAVGNLDCEYALTRLSGHPIVNCEVFSFKENRSGTKNILVNGEGSSCWIDCSGRIGSFDGGGPTIAQYIKWYGRSYSEIASVLKNLFSELPR